MNILLKLDQQAHAACGNIASPFVIIMSIVLKGERQKVLILEEVKV